MTATPTPDDGAAAPCPFCGAQPTVTESIGYWVQCKACPRDRTAWTWNHDKAKAIAIWNQRWQARSPAPVSGEAASELPQAAGFYWWQKDSESAWCMIQWLDFSGGQNIDYLAAYDLEHKSFGGRSRKSWLEHFPVGKWIGPLRRPQHCAGAGREGG